MLHISTRGEAPAITGLLQGDIDFIAATSGPISPRVRSGEFRALAVTGKTRWRDFPDVPTVVAHDWAEGMGASLRTGLAAVSATDAQAVVVTLVDLPDVGADVWIEYENGDPLYPRWVGIA